MRSHSPKFSTPSTFQHNKEILPLACIMAISSKTMKPARLAKAIALAFALGAILSVASDPNLTRQAEAMAVAKAQAIATSAMQKVGSTLGDWLEQWLDTALKGI
jgi:hypothetical protein